VLAALIGCAVHSLFDTPQRLPTISLILAIELALLLAPEEPRAAGRRKFAWILPLGWGLLLVTAGWSLWASLPFSWGIAEGNADRWREAAALLDAAAQRDPAFAYYQLQAGHAHGVLAAEDGEDELSAAIARYEAGVARSPNYGLTSANLGVLYWRAGREDEALKSMERAVDLAPGSALFRLNLGRLYEELGREDAARQQYEVTLNRAPDWAEAAFWRASPLREAAVEAWRAAHPPPEPVDAPQSPTEWSVVGRDALAAGRPEAAVSAYERAVSGNPQDIGAGLGLARAYLALGRHGDAERSLQRALLSWGTVGWDHARVLAALARVHHERHETEDAIRTLEGAIGRARRSGFQEPAILGWASYPWYLFCRESLDSYLLPQLAVITVTDEVADWMLELGGWYEEVGDTAAGARVYRDLLEEVPDSTAARERLAGLPETPQD
jgi:tetratricopeptide (TPR) repeat protein